MARPPVTVLYIGSFARELLLQIRAMPRKDVGLGVEIMLGVVDGGAGFAEAGGDELQLAGESADVAGGKDAAAASLHHGIDLDLPGLELQAQVFQRADRAFEADVHEDMINF